MRHRIDGKTSIGAANVNPCGRHPVRGETLANEENNSKRLLNNPVLDIKNAKAGEGEQAEHRKQLVAPFHGWRSECGRFCLSIPQNRGKPLVSVRYTGKVWRKCLLQSCF